jgi:hypothetical protein
VVASFYTHAAFLLSTKRLDLINDPLKILLLGSAAGGYVFNAAHQFIDPGINGPTSVKTNELIATNYVRGFGGSGRKSVSRTCVEDSTLNRVRVLFSNVTWPAIGGGGQNDTVVGAVLVLEQTSDADSLLIAYWDLPPLATAGRDVIFIADSINGNLQLLL